MEIDFATLGLPERYKLMTALVIPRPIAWISTVNAKGVTNCAPYSFFNAFCEDPPLVMASFSSRSDGQPKHSLANALATGEFVVNLVEEATADAMHRSSEEVDGDESEFEKTGLTPAPCRVVRHPRIAEAGASFECRVWRTIEVSAARTFIIGEILVLHTREGMVDPATYRIRDEAYKPVGRLYANRYCTTRQRFVLPGEIPAGFD